MCASLPRVPTRTRIHLVVHHHELAKPTGTARLLQRVLPNLELEVFGARADVASDLQEGDNSNAPETAKATPVDPLGTPAAPEALLLYPDLHARSVAHYAGLASGPVRLVVPDGTWSQTRRWRKRAALARELPSVRVDLKATDYQLRQSDNPEHLCTFEAVAYALAALESAAAARELFACFELWKRQQLASKAGGLPKLR